jgi:hypothetical protein
LGVCQAKNPKLIAVAQDILHLYQTPHFRSRARGNRDAVLGFKRVELENILQDNEDRILDQKYYPGERPPQVKLVGARPSASATPSAPAASTAPRGGQ